MYCILPPRQYSGEGDKGGEVILNSILLGGGGEAI